MAESGNKTAKSTQDSDETGDSVPAAAATAAATNGVQQQQQPAPDIEVADEAAEKLQDLAV